MAEAEQGTIIKDLGKSLPTLEDFFYNDLEGYDNAQLPDSAKTIFYQEAPPETAEFLGLSANGALLSIKIPKEAFNTNNLQGILCNAITGNSVRVDLSKADYGGFDNVKEKLEQFKNNRELSGYYATVGADNKDLYERKGMAFAANLRMLFCNLPELPRFVSTEVVENEIVHKDYKDVKGKTDQYKFCKTPYPYHIQYEGNADGAVSYYCDNYKASAANEKYNDTSRLSFVRNGNTYTQVIELDAAYENRYNKTTPRKRHVLVLNTDNSTEAGAVNGYKAKDILIQDIEEAKDIRLVLDINTLHNQAGAATYREAYPIDYTDKSLFGRFTNYINDLKNQIWDDGWYQYAGYVPYGLDKYHRISGVIYVQKEVENPVTKKKELVWYNLNKKMIAETNNLDSPTDSPSATARYHIENGPAELKPYTYNYANRTYVDRFWREAGSYEDKRVATQKMIFRDTPLVNLFPEGNGDYKTEEDVLYQWTVSLGDVTLFVPPESIRVVSQTDTLRVPLMRARGTVSKGRERSMQYIELNLFFNEDRGINGVPYTAKSPNGKTSFTYHMNGFRALLAQMKFTPFLPIINKYINEDLGIFAVCIENLDVSTVPNFPKLLKARILLSKFNYQIYMPEIPQPDNDSKILRADKDGKPYIERRNPFSACIDYDTMRWYYQRCIMLGEELDRLLQETDPEKRLDVNDLEFYRRTIFSNRTALLPYHFKDSTISLYVADEDHLKKLLQIKQDALRKSLNVSDNYNPTENEARLIKECNTLTSNVSIPSIYAKYIGMASVFKAAMRRAKLTKEKDVSDDGRKSQVIFHTDNTVEYKGKKYETQSPRQVNEFLNECLYKPMVEEYKAATQEIKNEYGDQIVSYVLLQESYGQVLIKLNTNEYLSSQDLKNTARESTVYLKSQGVSSKVKPEDVFKDASIVLKLVYADTSELHTDYLEDVINRMQQYYGSSNVINREADVYDSLKFLDWCKHQAKGIVDANDEASRLKQSIDYEDLHTLKYNLLLQNALVTQFSASVGNTYARIGVTGIDGSAPQYMGGQDTHLSWTIETKDEYVASVFKSLPELTAYYTRVYRKVLPTYPIKIDSEFSRIMGVMEITLDNVVVTTVEGFPGLYRIVVNATSVDRTLRNKEALKLLDTKEKGLTDSRKRTQVNIHDWKDLDTEFAKAEIYPDLELPTLGELGKHGWRYIRYRSKERTSKPDFYVDPDFYFIYPELTVGRAVIESLRCTFDKEFQDQIKEEDVTQYLTDTSGAQREVNKNGGINRNQMNKTAAEDEKDRIAQKINAVKQDRVYYTDALKSVIFRMPLGTFDICNKIRCVFTEPYYIQECEWLKDKSEKAKTPEENILTININVAKNGSRNVANEIDKALKNAGPSFQKVQFIDAKTKKEIKTVDNPNWEQKESQKIVDMFQKFEDCATELEQHLADKDDGLGFVSGDLSSVDFEARTSADAEEAKDATTVYTASQIQQFLESSGFWETTQKYGLFKENGFFTEGTDQSATSADIVYLIQAVADALCGKEECSTKNKTKGFGQKLWQADITATLAVNNNTVNATKDDLNTDKTKSFGIFGIKRYSYSELYRILPKEERDEMDKAFAQNKEQWYVLDPYFRMKDNDTKRKYLINCATNPSYCATAFLRIIIWYIAKLMRYHVIPSIEFDVKRHENINAADANKAATEFLKKQGAAVQQSTSTLFTELKEFAKNNGQAFDTGKFFAAILLALTEEGFGQNSLFSLYNQRNYQDLNSIVKSAVSVKYKERNENDPTYDSRNRLIRRYLLALYGYDIIKDPNKLANDVKASPSSKFLTNYNTKIALEACSNPAQYMRDSFYDAIRNDYRGRMLRAFPTFYMVFADEGREVGLWKLHDNFYSINAIHEIQIVKSRKIPADTCKIVLSNMFQTFTTNDEDCTINYKGSLGDLVTNFLNPGVAVQKEELKRLAAKKINRAKLQTGVRIHIRIGYGANAADLPCCFNGVISEIKPGELVTVVAQGDGVELCNPIYMEEDADVIKNNDTFLSWDKCVCGFPPKDIIQGFLTAKGGPMAAWLRDQYRSKTGGTAEEEAKALAKRNNEEGYASSWFDRDGFIMYGLLNIFNNNPFGIRHFGDPAYRDIFAQGEPAQNLYEITNRSESVFSDDLEKRVYFGDGALDLDDKLNGWSRIDDHNDLPWISFKPYGKTVWDILHICKSIAPDYMVGIADFQFRSTVFLGKPHYYYAYKYVCEGDGKTLYEKRKPFQQWHLYNNFSDIVDNKISASSEKMKTNATGIYEIEGDTGMQKTAPMWVDQDIYPEYQKSMVVDTKLFGKSWIKHNSITGKINAIPVLGWITEKLESIPAWFSNKFLDQNFASWFDQRGSVSSHSKTAEDAVINALKDSVKEMYQGYLIVLGDPSVKPYDRMQISDAYEDMDGLCDIREVVHTLNPYNGFTTTITPDAISAHDMKSEILKMNWATKMLARTGSAVSIALLGMATGNKLYAKGAEVVEKAKQYTTKTKLWEGLTKDGKQAFNFLKNTNTAKAGAATIKELLGSFGVNLTKGAKAASTGAAAATATASAAAGGATAGATVAAAGVALAPALIAAGIITIIGGAVNTALYRTIKGMQVLYIFPLRKYGKALTAGLDGQQGLVYGTIQFNTPGPLEQLVGSLFAHSKDSGFVGAAKDFIRGLFIDENIMEAADKFDFTEDSEFRQKAMSGNEKELSEASLQSVAGPQLDKALYQSQSAYSLSLMPRTFVDGVQTLWTPSVNQNKETIWQAVKNRYYINNIKDWVVNPNLQNLVYIEDDMDLKVYFSSGILRTLPQVLLNEGKNGTDNKDSILQFSVHMPRGETKQITGVKRTEKQNTGEAVVLDVPYLSAEGVRILNDLCTDIVTNSGLITKPDQRENEQSNKDTSIIISSALVVGSANPLYGSGFHMILTGTGKLGENGVLKKQVQRCWNKLQDQLKAPNSEYTQLPLFKIDAKIKKSNEVGIEIGVPSPFGNNITSNEKTETPIPKDIDTEEFITTTLLTDQECDQHVFYSDLDQLQRSGKAYARITYTDLIARLKTRESLQSINPAGWKSITYIQKDRSNELYNRCHIIAHSLEGEEANPKNLFTGTAEMNARMYVYEKKVADYLEKNQNSTVLYRVTPKYSGDNLLPSYVIMEATDRTLQKPVFNTVKIYNTAVGWEINYKTGEAKQK